MRVFKRESINLLRDKVDLIDLISSHVNMKRSGAFFKGLCPFHMEKTPSFIVQKGDTHYHCFGCGAHGDAIEFLMSYQKLSFIDAIEYLANRYNVSLEKEEKKGLYNTSDLKDVLYKAKEFFHFMLTNTEDGKEGLFYLYKRGIGLDFIKTFSIGYAPKTPFLFQNFMREKGIDDNLLKEAGLIKVFNNKKIDFFIDRIVIPIMDKTSNVIGFSSRKFKVDTFGPKYINTPETSIFKKSKILFGLSYCLRKIIKEQRVIIVEGQFDALRLIYEGISIAVAGQGTAFGKIHMQEILKLGVKKVYLALDSDKAGEEACLKIGDMFQKESVEVYVIDLSDLQDPDTFVMKRGALEFIKLLENAKDYLTFLTHITSKNVDMDSPADKNKWIQSLILRIKSWKDSLLIHESIKKIAKLTNVPLDTIQNYERDVYVKKFSSLEKEDIDPDKILETDFLRWLFFIGDTGDRFFEIAKLNVKVDDLKVDICKNFYEKYLDIFSKEKKIDLFLLAENIEEKDQNFISQMLKKKINREKAEDGFVESIQMVLDRNWIEKREKIKVEIQNAENEEKEVLELAKSFDEIKNKRPEVIFP